MKELALDGDVAKPKPKEVRAPKNRSISRPVPWSTKVVENVLAEEVGSSSSAYVTVVRRHASMVTNKMSYILTAWIRIEDEAALLTYGAGDMLGVLLGYKLCKGLLWKKDGC